jgi:aminopeptidase N
MALSDIHFRLFPNLLGGAMRVSDVAVDGQHADPGYSLGNSLMMVALPRPLQPGEQALIEMSFSVTIPRSVELNYGVLAYVDGILALAHAYPMIPVYDKEGWNAEVPSQDGDLTFTDVSFFIVQVTAPAELQLVAVGQEIERKTSGGKQVVTYAAGPVRDFYLAASAGYQAVTDKVGETTINFFTTESNLFAAREALGYTAQALQDFSRRYAPYPYTELDLVATPTMALGIEYPGMIAITSRPVSPGQDYLEATVAHEVGHQWFYNLVGSDQLDSPWMDESLTQFVTMQYFADKYGAAGEQGFRSSLQGRWDEIGDAAIPIGKPVVDYTAQQYSAIIYGRGGLFFDALKDKMGSRAFDKFMQDYTAGYSWAIAYPDDLKLKAEADCSCDLGGIFQEWVSP